MGRVIAVALVFVGALAGCEINPLFDPSIPAGGMLGDGEAAVTVGNLRAAWATPNTIRWEWDAQGDADELLAYTLTVGESEQDVLDQSGSSREWTEADNPELSRYLLPRTGGEDQVTFTATDELTPDTIYFAQLRATDTAGNVVTTTVAAGRTAEPAVDEIVIMSDQETAGYSLPDNFLLTEERPYAGTHAYRYDSICPDGDSTCWENLRRQELGLDLSAISQGTFATTAYFEVAVAIEGGTTPWWCSLWLAYDPGSERLANYGGWTARADGEYRLLQVPMREFEIQGAPTPYDELALGLFGFNVGCPWSAGSVVRVDEVRLRW
ncbi:MAG: hypothetical protein AAF721_21715 [Myxococcota bacterium]